METPQGRFLDPLADKILVLSAFFSFAYIGLIDIWMVIVIMFRDAIVTGLRVLMKRNGLHMVTSVVAKVKTAVQISVIIMSLVFLSAPVLKIPGYDILHQFMQDYSIVYYSTLAVALFTAYTGMNYIYKNRTAVKKLFLQS